MSMHGGVACSLGIDTRGGGRPPRPPAHQLLLCQLPVVSSRSNGRARFLLAIMCTVSIRLYDLFHVTSRQCPGTFWASTKRPKRRAWPRHPPLLGLNWGADPHFTPTYGGWHPRLLWHSGSCSQRSLALATADGDVVLHALANQFLGQAYEFQGDYRRVIDCFRQAVASLDGTRSRERFGQVVLPAVNSRGRLAECHAEMGTFAEGSALGAEGLRITEEVNHPGSLTWALYGIGLLYLRQGDLPEPSPGSNGP